MIMGDCNTLKIITGLIIFISKLPIALQK